ncbi:S8/S53 family peptidase [Microbacterium sp. SD291]|uniref:S8 family peptidase n=1 Tax=Microbacterium sp. SD291 TaxID=2782007 RepID=UPI001A95E0E2|nr:S8/S53 family peptidase [Microbacterium sp. SD291]MBO0980780.1 S8/S53 family peptidase [Microbacterium sp. SD291]
MSDQDATMRDPDDWREVRRFALLDPSGEVPGSVFPTLYVADELLVHTAEADPRAIEELRALAAKAGWALDLDAEDGGVEGPRSDPKRRRAPRRSRGASTSVLLHLGVASDADRVVATPDAWALLRQARRSDWGRRGIGLNHVLTTDTIGLNPFKANPFKANPFKANPFKANPFKANAGTVGIGSYGDLGTGGLQPVTYLGPAPARRHPNATPPIVAVFDTGAGEHPWLADAVIEPRLRSGEPIGIDPASPTDPERDPSLAEPLDGIFDDAAGHGTFIAGIIRQECPDAMILPARIADGEGVILENDLIGALGRLVEFMDDTTLEKKRGGSRVAVLNLSFSYYHETPDDPGTVSELGRLLDEIRGRGCAVVCSAGNEATSRPTYPAAIPAEKPDLHVSVGALNPSDRSVALFSNVGDWVEVYAPGVSLLSTVPVAFEGGIQAGTRDDGHGRRRQTLDVDDFRGGFGVWSGTSFAAPVVAGRIAAQIVAGESPDAAKKIVVSELAGRDRSRME